MQRLHSLLDLSFAAFPSSAGGGQMFGDIRIRLATPPETQRQQTV